MNGEIVWYNETKRYGFVRPSEGGAEVVFCLDEVQAAALAPVTRGQAVHFMVQQDASGPRVRHLAPGHLQGESI